MVKNLDGEKILGEIINIAREKFGIKKEIKIDPQNTLEDIGLDSLESIDYQMEIEEFYEINLEKLDRISEVNPTWYLTTTFRQIKNYVLNEL